VSVEQETAHPPLRTVSDVVGVVRSILDQIELDEHEALNRIAQAAPGPFPSRSSGAEPAVGGPTNRTHDFGTGAVPELELVPQHSDPVGEAVAWDVHQSADMPALRDAFGAALQMMRKAEECRSHLAKTRRREQMQAEDRTVCALCMDAGYKTDLGVKGRDSNVNNLASHKPRCGWHYEFVLTNKRDAPLELTVMHLEGKRIYDADIRRALGPDRKAKNKRRKGKRR
jgi:hypothetical protein